MEKSKDILIVAGEASGDLRAAELVQQIKNIRPDLKFFGLGGERLKNEGVEISYDITRLAVVGLLEVLKHLREFKRIFDALLVTVDKKKPALAILVDYPGFNLRLAQQLKKRNIPVIYYISPQVWAWGSKRTKTIKEVVERMIVFFKFEEELYRKENIRVSFVGHPLLDTVRPGSSKDELMRKLKISPAKFTVALLPGSREKEVNNILPIMLDSAKLLQEDLKDIRFLILRSSTVRKEVFLRILAGYDRDNLKLQLLDEMTYEGITASDFALVASGTATLEVTILGVPMAILYKVSFFSWLYLRLAIKLAHIGMVNIIAGREIVPEFIQYRAKPRKIADHVKGVLTNPRETAKIKAELSSVVAMLGDKNASLRAAEIIVNDLAKLSPI
jgi:lipid-A-disaccharide synthase